MISVWMKLRSAAATGINATLEAVLADLVRNVPRRSGYLASHFRIERVTPENLTGKITNATPYGNHQYPYRLYPGTRFPGGYPAPSLFRPKTSRVGILGPGEVGTEAIANLAKANIEAAMKNG